jgi:hypothetical protein
MDLVPALSPQTICGNVRSPRICGARLTAPDAENLLSIDFSCCGHCFEFLLDRRQPSCEPGVRVIRDTPVFRENLKPLQFF